MRMKLSFALKAAWPGSWCLYIKFLKKKKAQEELRISAHFQKYALSELPVILGDETTL